MNYTIEQIAKAIKAARVGRRLSQRALSKKAGIPQSHISNIERGAVDIKLSTLIELARALNLEVTLVPRKLIPAVQSMTRIADAHGPDAHAGARVPSTSKPAYSLEDANDASRNSP